MRLSYEDNGRSSRLNGVLNRTTYRSTERFVTVNRARHRSLPVRTPRSHAFTPEAASFSALFKCVIHTANITMHADERTCCKTHETFLYRELYKQQQRHGVNHGGGAPCQTYWGLNKSVMYYFSFQCTRGYIYVVIYRVGQKNGATLFCRNTAQICTIFLQKSKSFNS